MLVVSRYRVAPAEVAGFESQARSALEMLAVRTGFVDGQVGQCVDDPELWTLTTRWRDVGSYRRGLSGYDVKVAFAPLQPMALDEPSAYQVAFALPPSDSLI